MLTATVSRLRGIEKFTVSFFFLFKHLRMGNWNDGVFCYYSGRVSAGTGS
jgi:hypothetical protein